METDRFSHFWHKSVFRNWLNVFVKLVILALLFLVLNPSAYKKEDVGKCTISIYGGDKEVYDDISIEEC